MDDKQETNFNFECTNCKYYTNRISEWHRHISTAKHIKKCSKTCEQHIDEEIPTLFVCDICDKTYNLRASYWYHKKKCTPLKAIEPIPEPFSEDIEAEKAMVKSMVTPETFMLMFNQNNSLTNFLMEQSKNMNALIEKIGTSTNSNSNSNSNNNYTNYNQTNNQTTNQTFNLHFFLNETCKNAMNLTDFIDQIEITMEDLEDMRRLGYSDGVSNIFVKNLEKISLSDRPVHSNDVKRELFYIRNNNKWFKETDDYMNLIKAIKAIANKNFAHMIKWREQNPEYNDPTTKTHDIHHQMIINMINGNDEEARRNYKKIIRNIATKVFIPKSGYIQ